MSVSVLKKGLPLTVVMVALLGMTGAASASAAEPWWHVTVSMRPSALHAGAGQNEVQEITGTPGSTTYLIFELEVEGKVVGSFWSATFEEPGLKLKPDTAANIQKALEGAYGAGNVEAEGVSVHTSGVIVKSVNGDASRPVPPIVYKVFAGNPNAFGKGEAKVVTAGQADGRILVLASNLGDAAANGSGAPIKVSDVVPSGLQAVAIHASEKNGTVAVGCELATLSCAFNGSVAAYDEIEVEVSVNVQPGAKSGEERDTATVEGGGAPSAASGSLTVSYGNASAFGVSDYEINAEAEGGAPVTQAGKHPFQLTTTLLLNEVAGGEPAGALVRDLESKLPVGLIGNPQAIPTCNVGTFLTITKPYEAGDACPDDTVLGVARVIANVKHEGVGIVSAPLYNLVPEHGEPARFGFYGAGIAPVVLDTAVRTGGDYGVTVSAHSISQLASLLGSEIIFWGVPGDTRHAADRGLNCLRASEGEPKYTCNPLAETNPEPFLSLPTSCNGPMQAPLLADSWQRPGYVEEFGLAAPMPALDGCNKERFEPTIKKTTPDYEEASRPSGLAVDVHVPQGLQTVAGATAESEVKQIEVTLPKGVTVNPGGAGGLEACMEHEVGYEGKEEPGQEVAFEFFSPIEPEPFCPKQAKIATVTIHTPLLPNPLEGAVYLANPAPTGEAGQNPYRSLLAMYLVAEDPVSGTLVKLPMHVSLNEATGQVTTVVENPQLPFEDAELHFFGGGRAPLATPGLCGAYTTKAVFTPWSGQEPVTSTSTFHITSGPNGSACPSNPKPFTPEFNSGTVNNQAASFSELRTTMGHPDVDQALAGLRITLPPGLSGELSHVKLCPEPQAREGTCGPESLIGHTTVTAGLGSTPAVVARPGDVYITGPYNGAPFGLSIANPAETGPFDLDRGTPCDCTVVRAKVEIDPHTAQITVTTPAPGTPGAIPTMLKGIPLDLQHVSVQIDRKEFTFNPTNCEALKVTGSISGAEGGVLPISEPFQAANCATLPFKPGFSVRTSARHTRKGGDGLHVVVTSSHGQANIAKVHVELPKVLPSRLTTLQKACTEAQFDSNPAGCPAGSIVGRATIHTPLVPVPLEGPAYFVSHGGAKFPELVMVVQGYGITVDLSGETFISKKGITSSSFNSTPDVPFNRFDLVLPAGRYSALAGIGNLCAHPLYMPTTLTGQNGAVVKRRTRIAVAGCKPELLVLRHHAKGLHATIVVRVPSAGTLTVTGAGIERSVKRAPKAKTLTIKVTLNRHDRRVLATHPHERVNAKVRLRFVPRHGRPLSAQTRLLIG